MIKQKLAAFVASIAMVAVPFISSATASVEYDGMKLNGQQVLRVRAGSSYNIMARSTFNAGQEAEYARVITKDSQGVLLNDQCVAIAPPLVDVTNGQLNINGVKTYSDWPDTGTIVHVDIFGITGPQQSNRCDDNNFVTSQEWSGRLFIDHNSSVSNVDVVVGGSSSTGTGAGTGAGSADSFWASLFANVTPEMVKQWLGVLNPKPAVCTGLDAKVAAATPGVRTSANTKLQEHLGTKGYASYMPALYPVATTAFGFYGSQTDAAVNAALNDC